MEKDIKTILIANNGTGEATLCKSENPLEYSFIIKSLENIYVEPSKIYDVDIIVKETVKSFGVEMEDINPGSEVAPPDMTIIVTDGMPLVWANTEDRNKAIFVGKIYGNCIDKFMAHNMNTFMSNMRIQSMKIENGAEQRMQEKNYHDSAVFETDFAALTALRKMCLKLADKIGRLQENLTNNEYTS